MNEIKLKKADVIDRCVIPLNLKLSLSIHKNPDYWTPEKISSFLLDTHCIPTRTLYDDVLTKFGKHRCNNCNGLGFTD